MVEAERRLSRFALIPLDLAAVDEYARLRVECESRGLTFGYHDLWIGAIAISRNLTLVSCDEHQCEIPRLDSLYLPPRPSP
jgi:predicted nucleic acid-binding protein